MSVVRIASFNVENLFQRPKAFNPFDWDAGEPVVAAYKRFNSLISKERYTTADKSKMIDDLITLDIYRLGTTGVVRKAPRSDDPQWAWLRKNRGSFDLEPSDIRESVEIVADGRADWIGWVELAVAPTNEIGVEMTAKVVRELDAHIIGIVEAEDRPSLVRFNEDMLDDMYRHVMLVDGNDDRGIDVGLMTADGFDIESIRSNVDLRVRGDEVFDRDCPQYEVTRKDGVSIHVLVNHFKSQIRGGGGPRRRLQAKQVRKIVESLVAQGEHVVVLGDLNEGPKKETKPVAENLAALFDPAGPLVDCYGLPTFDVGPKPGSFQSCGIRDRLDYILISKSLEPAFKRGKAFRKGLWGDRKSRPDAWETYGEMTEAIHQASDHAALAIELDL